MWDRENEESIINGMISKPSIGIWHIDANKKNKKILNKIVQNLSKLKQKFYSILIISHRELVPITVP